MIYFVIVLVIVAAEYGIKRYMNQKLVSEDKLILGGRIRLNLYHNKGIALNFFANNAKLIKIVTGSMIGILLLILAYLAGARKSRMQALGLSFLLGGALSNFIDRETKGYVVDYISFDKVKKLRHIVFNIADFAIFIGGILVIIAEMISGQKK